MQRGEAGSAGHDNDVIPWRAAYAHCAVPKTLASLPFL